MNISNSAPALVYSTQANCFSQCEYSEHQVRIPTYTAQYKQEWVTSFLKKQVKF